MKRTIKHSLIFSLIIHVLFLVGTIGYGYFKTLYYVPGIVNAYDEVQYLQNEVAFGIVSRPLTPAQFVIVSFLLTCFLFILFKTAFNKLYKK
ncbi:hypothetical protein ACNQFZ_20030 [Schinkia sp. CFF1]